MCRKHMHLEVKRTACQHYKICGGVANQIAINNSENPTAQPPFWLNSGPRNSARYFGLTSFMLTGLYRNMPVFLRGQLSDSGTQSKCLLRPVSIKCTNLHKLSTGKSANTHRLSFQWSVVLQRDSRNGYRMSR